MQGQSFPRAVLWGASAPLQAAGRYLEGQTLGEESHPRWPWHLHPFFPCNYKDRTILKNHLLSQPSRLPTTVATAKSRNLFPSYFSLSPSYIYDFSVFYGFHYLACKTRPW